MHPCEFCFRCYPTFKSLLKHVKSDHYEVMPRCELCAKPFVNQKLLEEHKRKHRQKRHVACPMCLVIIRKDFMEWHMEEIHPLATDWVCDVCNEIFLDIDEFRCHIKTCVITRKDCIQADVPLQDNIQDDVTLEDNIQADVTLGDNIQPDVPLGENIQADVVPLEDNIQADVVPLEDNIQAEVAPLEGNIQADVVPLKDNIQVDVVPLEDNIQVDVVPLEDDIEADVRRKYELKDDYLLELLKDYSEEVGSSVKVHQRRVQCCICYASFIRDRDFLNHMDIKHRDPIGLCEACKFPFYSNKDILEHKRNCWLTWLEKVVKKREQCKECMRTFLNKKFLKIHQEYMHPAEKPKIRCLNGEIECDQEFDSYSELLTHVESCHDNGYKSDTQ